MVSNKLANDRRTARRPPSDWDDAQVASLSLKPLGRKDSDASRVFMIHDFLWMVSVN